MARSGKSPKLAITAPNRHPIILLNSSSDPFGSPRLHGREEGDFSVVDVEFYALRPLW